MARKELARAEQTWSKQSRNEQNRAGHSRQKWPEQSRKEQREAEQTIKKAYQSSYLDLFIEGSNF